MDEVEHEEEVFNGFEVVEVKTEGESFGENALLQNDIGHAFTAKTSTACDMCVLNREDFLKLFGKSELKKQQQKLDFFINIPMFASWSK